MAQIRGRGNRDTELRLVALFRANGIKGWRRHPKLFGKPDFVFRKERVLVFVDGCFWHRHQGCRFAYTPKSRLDFWMPKFERNIARDKVVTRALRQAGWRVVRVWECDLTPSNRARTVRRMVKILKNAFAFGSRKTALRGNTDAEQRAFKS